MDIYVSKLPKDCSECPMCRSGNLKLQKKGRYIEAKQCVFGQYKYQTIDNEIDTCPLKPLSDRLAEERNKVVQEIRDLAGDYFEMPYCDACGNTDFNDVVLTGKDLTEILDDVERGE